MSSNNLEKYEYLTGEDLGLKSSAVEQAKFEYSPLDKIFNKGLSEEESKEGLLKRLENIKDKNEELLNVFNKPNKASKNNINIQSKNLINDSKYSFVKYKDINDIKKLSLDSMYKKLNKFNDEIIRLKNVASRKEEKKELKNKVLSNAGDLYKNLYYAYKDKYNKGINSLDTKNREKLYYKKLKLSDDLYSSEEEQEEKTKTDANAFNEQIIKEEADINTEVFFKYFSVERPSQLFKYIYKIDNIDKKKYDDKYS